MLKIERKIHKIDATGKVLGRLAVQITQFLMGKNKADYRLNVDNGDIVIVQNAGKVKITGKKLEQKNYYRHSQYPGGLKSKKMNEIFLKNPAEILKKAVWNMLPKNKLRKPRIKRLRFV